MNHPEIVRYIEKAQQAQMTEGEIRDALFRAGWVPGDIIEAFQSVKGSFASDLPAPRHNTMISAYGVKKYFGDVKALEGIDLEVPMGSVLALLGPNGAGKTTLVKIMTTLLSPTEGSVHIGGYDVAREGSKVREIIGLAGQHAAIDEYLTGRENLQLIGRLCHLEEDRVKRKSEELLQRFDLLDAADRSAKTYSGGMRKRLDLAASLMSNPQVVFLDEPTTGLDPRSRNELWSIVKELVATGVTILLTTQYLEEADHLADQIAVIDHGRLIAKGTSRELKSMIGGEILDFHVTRHEMIHRAGEAIGNLGTEKPRIDEASGHVTLPVKQGSQALIEAVRRLDMAHVPLEDIILRRPTLDEVFLKLTGHPAENEHA